ncbi:MAG: glucose-1-phosphate thymidylyltransferase RfbA [bacterium]|nr:glucose-1-phosphate thymidylyltransferase RfbA [bacterium]
MKGIVLAGGKGSRLYPLTLGVSKHLMPVYDKPMIYYPLSVLMIAGIREILIISTAKDVILYEKLLGNGSQFGIKISYAVQNEPKGIAEALLIGENFINGDSVALILGDNIFYGYGFSKILEEAAQINQGATVFSYFVNDPESYGIVETNSSGEVFAIEEKPTEPKSNYAITGLYFYDGQAASLVKELSYSSRGELEITDLNKKYLELGMLEVERLGRGMVWFDTGTHDSLLEASALVKAIEHRQGLKIACLEELAYSKGYISKNDLLEQAEYFNNQYGEYLKKVARDLL